MNEQENFTEILRQVPSADLVREYARLDARLDEIQTRRRAVAAVMGERAMQADSRPHVTSAREEVEGAM